MDIRIYDGTAPISDTQKNSAPFPQAGPFKCPSCGYVGWYDVVDAHLTEEHDTVTTHVTIIFDACPECQITTMPHYISP